MAERSEAVGEQAVRDGSAVYSVEPEVAATEEVPLGYKRTEVGIIPQDWGLQSLTKLSAFITKGSTPTTYGFKWEDYGYLFLRSECVSKNGLDLAESMFISAAAHQLFQRSEVTDGDLLITITGNVGRVVRFSGVGAANINQHIARIRITDTDTSAEYIFHYLSQPKVRCHFETITTGQAYPQISLEQVRDAVVPLPVLSEQRAIATALSDADALIESLDRLIAKKRAIKQAAMQQLLTGQTRLPGFSGEWAMKRLGDISHIKTGDRNNQDKIEDGVYPFFVRSEHVERINSYAYECEAIVVPGEGRIGDIFHYVNGRFDVHQRVYAITQFRSEISPKFVYYYMEQNFGDWAMRNTVKATVDSLRLPTFQTFELTLPPTEDEQVAIAAVLSDMESEIETLEDRLDKAQKIKQGLMQQLLTGRIRLVQPDAAA